MAIAGHYAYVANSTYGTFSVVNISNPLSPSVVGTAITPGAYGVAVSGNYAYVSNGNSNTVSVVDISSSTAPTVVNTITVGNAPTFMAAAGNYAYVMNSTDGTMSTVNIGGINDAASLRAGVFEAGNANIDNNLDVVGSINSGTSLSVGAGGIMSNGALAVTATSAPSYFGDSVGIGTTTPSATLTVAGTPTSTLMRLVGFGAGTLQTDANGNFTVSSDERLKNIVGDFTPGLTEIEGLTPINYYWNATSGLDMTTEYSGFSAQNVQEYIPTAVATNSRGYLTLDERPIIAALVNAVKQIGSFVSGIADGLAHLTGIAIGTQAKPEGITMYDESTKQPYCVVINNGILLNNPGTCGQSSSANNGNTATVLNAEGNSSGNTNNSTTTTAISIIPSNPAISVGSTTAFSLIDQNNNALSTSTAWGISDLSVGTIDANGLFTASSTGTAIITAIAGPFSASTTIVVSAAPSVTSDISVSTSTTTSNETVSPSISSTSTDSTANTSSSTTSQ